MDSLLYQYVSGCIGAIPAPQPVWIHDLVDCEEPSMVDGLPALLPFPVLGLASNGGKNPHFQMKVTGKTVGLLAEECGILHHELPMNACGPVQYAINDPFNQHDDAKVHHFEVSKAYSVGTSAHVLQGTLGAHTYQKKYVRASGIKPYKFFTEPRQKGLVEELVTATAGKIAQSTNMPGDCVLIGVVTTAYVGRLEILGVKASAGGIRVTIGNEGLQCDATANMFQKIDNGATADSMIGAKMECFLLMKDHSENATPSNWLASSGFTVTNWADDHFQNMLVFAQNRDRHWKQQRRLEFFRSIDVFNSIEMAEHESKLSPSKRKRRRREIYPSVPPSVASDSSTTVTTASSTGVAYEALESDSPERLPPPIVLVFDRDELRVSLDDSTVEQRTDNEQTRSRQTDHISITPEEQSS